MKVAGLRFAFGVSKEIVMMAESYAPVPKPLQK